MQKETETETETEERETFYHYTDEKGAKGITESGVIKQSKGERGDALFGDGTYLTRVPPTESKCDIVANNWDNDTQTNKGHVEDVVEAGNGATIIFMITLANRPVGRFLPRDACSAKCGIATLSRPSVRPSVTLRYRKHIGWTSSKLIT